VLALAAADLRADGPSRSGVLTALPSLPEALARRRRISPWLEGHRARLASPPPRPVSEVSDPAAP
jgi:hypothetical protein